MLVSGLSGAVLITNVQVNFNEPLSMLQRMLGDIVYSDLLAKAVQSSNTIEEAAYVAAFSNSPYANTIGRTGKPFNPLLFETYECDRRADPKFGWRVISEQVSIVGLVWLAIVTCPGRPLR